MVAKIGKETSSKKFLLEIKSRITRISIFIIIVFFICMTMSIALIDFQYIKIPIIYFKPSNNISIQIISFMKFTLLPKNVTLIQVAPGQAFMAQIQVSIITSIVICLPIIVREIVAFITPALKFNEIVSIKKTLFPSVILFAIGGIFSYCIVIPFTIEFLYKYGQTIGVVSFFDINQFVSFTLNFLVLFGFSYQLPLIMLALTEIKAVKPNFWKNNFRYILMILILFGAFITPDGSGITMWFVVGPLLLLYLIGLVIVKWKFNNNIHKLP